MKDFINHEGSTPLYTQIADSLRERITSEFYSAGEKIPSEKELGKHFGVSRITLRNALDILRHEGHIYSVPGKGTYVSNIPVEANFHKVDSITNDILRLGKKPGIELIEVTHDKLPDYCVDEMKLDRSESILKVVRLRTANENPIALSTSWLNSIFVPELLGLDYSALSLYELFEKELGLVVFDARSTIYADHPLVSERKLLGIKSNDPILRVNRVTYFKDVKQRNKVSAIEYAEIVFIGHTYRIHA